MPNRQITTTAVTRRGDLQQRQPSQGYVTKSIVKHSKAGTLLQQGGESLPSCQVATTPQFS